MGYGLYVACCCIDVFATERSKQDKLAWRKTWPRLHSDAVTRLSVLQFLGIGGPWAT